MQNNNSKLILSWQTEQDTALFCRNLANLISNNKQLQNLYIRLDGDLGAGKTTFTRYLLTNIGIQENIKSPTYAIMESYLCTELNLNIYHFDCYRITSPYEWEEAGFRDSFAQPGIKLVEWADKVQQQLPKADLQIKIAISDLSSRTVQLQAHSTVGQQLLKLI